MPEDFPVSVIVCTHNRAKCISSIIRLLQDQDYSKDKYEIIVVDNGSKDNTKTVVQSLMPTSGVRVRYVFESRRGVSFARNRGSEVALNPYLAYIDDDCTVGPEWLRTLMSGYDLHKDVFAAFGQIVNDWGVQIKPRWIMPATETWLGDNSFLGNSPKILENDFGIRESNLSINKEMLQSLGGFLGMELFGSHSRAATELRYCLWRAKKMDIRIAYIPAAIAHHHIAVKSRTQMIQRAYWQGVSDGILEYIMYRGPWWNTGARAGLNMAAMIVLFGFALFYFVLFDQPKWIFYGMRATRRLGLILSELHLKGSFSRMRAWLAEQSS